MLHNGAGIDIVSFLNKRFPNTEFHATGYRYLGPNTKLEEKIPDYHKLVRSSDTTGNLDRNVLQSSLSRVKHEHKPINRLDASAQKHDLYYAHADTNFDGKQALKKKHEADAVLQQESWDAVRDGSLPWTTRALAGLTAGTMFVKRKLGLGIDGQPIYKNCLCHSHHHHPYGR